MLVNKTKPKLLKPAQKHYQVQYAYWDGEGIEQADWAPGTQSHRSLRRAKEIPVEVYETAARILLIALNLSVNDYEEAALVDLVQFYLTDPAIRQHVDLVMRTYTSGPGQNQ